jgi:aspartyl-tRNA synthetase
MRSFLLDRGFTELHTPKLMGAASESGAEVFRVDYFGSSAYLAQSPQFYKQMAIAAGFDRVMEVGPVFRAEQAGWAPGDRSSEGLDGEGERMLSKLVLDKSGHQFVFVTDYPVSVRPFYHMRPADDPTVTCSFDLIWNGLEVTTGAQREHGYEVLVAQAAEKGIALEPISHYVNCFRYGCPPHGGLGIGINRLLMKLLDLPSIREASLFFRGPNRLTP